MAVTVTNLTPAHHATNVDPATGISVTFQPGASKSMDPTTIGMTVYDNRNDPTTGLPCAFSPYFLFDNVTGSLSANAVTMGWTGPTFSNASPAPDELLTTTVHASLQAFGDYGEPGISTLFAIAGWYCTDSNGDVGSSTAQNFGTGAFALSATVPSLASAVGGIDDAVGDNTADGRPFSASHLALMSRLLNYTVTRGDCCWSAQFEADPSTSDNTGSGALKYYGTPIWTPITPPFPIPKKPGRGTLDFYFGGLAGADQVIWLQVITKATGSINNAAQYGTANNVTRLVGAGSTHVDGQLTGIFADREANFETVQLYALGLPTLVAGSTGSNGAPNTGTVYSCFDHTLTDVSATWNVTGSGANYSLGHTVRVNNGAGALVLAPRLITNVTTATTLNFWPPSPLPVSSLRGMTYTIEKCAEWSLQYMSLYTAGD